MLSKNDVFLHITVPFKRDLIKWRWRSFSKWFPDMFCFFFLIRSWGWVKLILLEDRNDVTKDCANHNLSYCLWKKSCTSWYGKYPIIYRLLYIPSGCLGVLPSTVWLWIGWLPLMVSQDRWLPVFGPRFFIQVPKPNPNLFTFRWDLGSDLVFSCPPKRVVYWCWRSTRALALNTVFFPVSLRAGRKCH